MSSEPFISVVIPTCQRNDLLAKCLAQLAPGNQPLPASGYEVIVTDDGRVGTAEEMVRREFSFARWVAGPRRGPAANRNNGARQARGEWIAFTDDDCVPDSGWLGAIKTAGLAGRADVIEGRTEIPDKVDSPFKEGIENRGGGVFWSCNLAVRRSVFEKLGGFDEDFTEPADEDLEFARRFRELGYPAMFAREALVLHPVREVSWRSIWKRTKMARWHELFYLKQGADRSSLVALVKVFTRMGTALLRNTWHLYSQHDASTWRRRWFWIAWRWLTFPVITPYVAYWHLRFRRMLEERARSSAR